MNDRKQHVMKKAHQLFIDKGFHATSINDILEYSGISKGTFYNYFSSKNELIMELFKTNYKQLQKDRNDLLIGQDPADIELFIKQIEMQIVLNRKYKLLSLFEEIMAANDRELKEFFKNGQLMMLKWLYNRFIDLFGEERKPYLLDCAIMFMGILSRNLNYYSMATEKEENGMIQDVIRYSVGRLRKIVEEVSTSKEQLFQPNLLERWLPEAKHNNFNFQEQLYRIILTLKREISQHPDVLKFNELLDFIYEEMLDEGEPRHTLINLAIASLAEHRNLFGKKQLDNLEKLVLHSDKKK